MLRLRTNARAPPRDSGLILFAEEAGPPHLAYYTMPTTLVVSRPTDKSPGIYCNLLNNIVLARRARTWPPRGSRTVASYSIPDYAVLLGIVYRSTIPR